MNEEKIIDAMEFLEEKYIDEASPEKAAPMKSVRKNIAVRWVSVAAGICVFVILTVILLPPRLKMGAPQKLPTYTYTAEELGAMFDSMKYNGATSSYTEVYVPSSEYLNLSPLSKEKYLQIYEKADVEKPLDKQELANFYDGITARLIEKTGAGFPSSDIMEEEEELFSEDKSLSISGGPAQYDTYYSRSEQNSDYNYFMLRHKNGSDGTEYVIKLGDVKIQVDQTETDEEIIAGIDEIRDALFYLFDVDFSDISIVRGFDDYGDNGVQYLNIYFYNKKDHFVNENYDRRIPLSDYISISFDNAYNFADDLVSDKILTNAKIVYHQNRFSAEEMYPATKTAERISLKEAEALLKKGYVFGGHSCPLCMAAQPAVDFSDYDFVEMKYVRGTDGRGDTKAIVPFYIFYKKIGISENGNEIYAKTYVPAIEVSGYEEYFELQRKTHKVEQD
ncbi:MAG: hypothetical protein J6A50_05125 [Clostridia bacterium]|nr:hypothetical protein [Clostridia bacterium]